MRSFNAILVVGAGAALIGSSILWHDKVFAKPSAATVPATPVHGHVAAPGHVEPASEEVHIGAEVPGKLKLISVREGSIVRVGQVIAVLENSSNVAEVHTAEAQVSERKAELERVVNGARIQERLEAAAKVAETEAVLANSSAEWNRRQGLLTKGAISREEAGRSESEWRAAEARRNVAIQRMALVDDSARQEDTQKASAMLAIAQGELAQAQAALNKTLVRAPIAGVVLRKYHNAGETIANTANDPIVSLGNTGQLRVRTEIDETDIAAIHLGQRAYVTADAFRDAKFYGVVTQIGQEVGRKKVWKDDPSERTDTHVLEVMIDLEKAKRLPSGLRVDVFIQIGDESRAAQ